jgi:hypothetical protein
MRKDMNAKQWTVLVTCAAASLCFAAKNAAQNYNNGSQQTPSQQAVPPKNNTQPPSTMTPKKADCSQLTADEQDFANQLSPNNKMAFCNKFDGEMRQSAMGLSGQMGTDGTLLTNDQAVEKTARDNNVLIPSSTMRQGSGCPAK